MGHVIENYICKKMMRLMSIDGQALENGLKGKAELKFHKIAIFAHFPIHFKVDMVALESALKIG